MTRVVDLGKDHEKKWTAHFWGHSPQLKWVIFVKSSQREYLVDHRHKWGHGSPRIKPKIYIEIDYRIFPKRSQY